MNYNSQQGQSIYDLCNQTYGTLNELFRFVKDNNIDSLNQSILTKKRLFFEYNLVKDKSVLNFLLSEEIFYSTSKESGVNNKDDKKQFEDDLFFDFEDGTPYDFN